MIFLSTLIADFFELIWRVALLLFVCFLPFWTIWSAYLWVKLRGREKLVANIIGESTIKFKVKLHWSYILPQLSVYDFLKMHKIVSNLWNFFSIRIFLAENSCFVIKGLISPQIREIPIQNIVNITVTLSMIFGSRCGNIHIYHGEKTMLCSIANPLELKEILMAKPTNPNTIKNLSFMD
ncbi:hypothetical protein [Emticicia oligotrophica]|uniref:hypothetical protein n=1 Tax=Emticicia oligotrophica TaxID=312279 RepID=UPI0005A2FBDE|nr:hypothetical protein [Emticicia oligotrophica]